MTRYYSESIIQKNRRRIVKSLPFLLSHPFFPPQFLNIFFQMSSVSSQMTTYILSFSSFYRSNTLYIALDFAVNDGNSSEQGKITREKESLDREIFPKWRFLFQSQWKILRLMLTVPYKILNGCKRIFLKWIRSE